MDERSRDIPWVIIGGGFTGSHLAERLLIAGAEVVATRRSGGAAAELAAATGARAVVADLAEPTTLAALPLAGAVIVDTAPPGPGEPEGERALVRAAAAAGARRIVYVSSTGVYPPSDGRWMDEDQPVAPASERNAARLAAESALLEAAEAAGVDAVTLRASGIYGPGRGVIERMKRGNYRIIGDGDTYVNRIHVYDLASAIILAGVVERLPSRVYNLADDEPATSTEHAYAVAEALQLPPPPHVPTTDVSSTVVSMLGANRRISNRRVKQELGLRLRYPSWRVTLAEETTP